MKTANLTGALLDYWTARAEGIPAEQLSIRPVPRTDVFICVREWQTRDEIIGPDLVALHYSTDWARGGPLIEKHKMDTCTYAAGGSAAFVRHDCIERGDHLLHAVCRAVVRSAFGGEVEDLPC